MRTLLVALLVAACGPTHQINRGPVLEDSCSVRTPRELIAPRDQVTDARAVRFSIARADPSEEDSPALRVRLHFRNVSDSTLWMNRTFGDPPCSGCAAEVRIEHVGDGSGAEEVPCTARSSPPSLESLNYLALRPGDEISTVLVIPCLHLPNPGPWRISVRYQDPSPEPLSPPPGARWFSGVATSNSIEILANSL